MKKSLVLGILGAALVLSGCSDNKDVPQPGVPATKIKTPLLGQQQSVETELKVLGIEYLSDYHELSAKRKLIRPCEDGLPKKLEDAQVRLVRIQKALDTDAELAGFEGKAGYSKEALLFYGKVSWQVESLSKISSSISAFCKMDQAKIAACVGSGEQVRVLINLAVSGFETVHPLLLPTVGSELAIYSTDNRGDSIRALNVADGEHLNENDFQAFMKTISLPEIQEITECLDTSGLKSEVGLQLLDTAHLASVQSDIECRDERPNILFCAL